MPQKRGTTQSGWSPIWLQSQNWHSFLVSTSSASDNNNKFQLIQGLIFLFFQKVDTVPDSNWKFTILYSEGVSSLEWCTCTRECKRKKGVLKHLSYKQINIRMKNKVLKTAAFRLLACECFFPQMLYNKNTRQQWKQSFLYIHYIFLFFFIVGWKPTATWRVR